jgi:hypothetical protein
LAVVVGVVRKFGDDQAGMLATSLAYSGFVAVFPLLLLFFTVLGFVLGGSDEAREAVLRSALVESRSWATSWSARSIPSKAAGWPWWSGSSASPGVAWA